VFEVYSKGIDGVFAPKFLVHAVHQTEDGTTMFLFYMSKKWIWDYAEFYMPVKNYL
jgi:hypothetical protein